MSDPKAASGIDFAALSTQFRVIATTPAWEIVRDAIGRLGADPRPEQDPGRKRDIDHVRSFATVLRQDGNVIALALLCGAAIGQAAPSGDKGERFVAGLGILARAFRFHEKGEPTIRLDLTDLASKIQQWFEVDLTAYAKPNPVSVADLQPYKGNLRHGLEEVRRRVRPPGPPGNP